MRFLADGPWIPDELLTARDDGRVIFFCGAGISRARANLPDFFELAEKVVNTLGVAPTHSAKKIIAEAREIEGRVGVGGLISADRVFGLLEREFLVRDIAAAVAQALKPQNEVDLSAHRIMLELATGPAKKTRLVTTNFDLLFEACHTGIPSWQPPTLPDPRRHDDLQGIIHLHGRVNDGYSAARGDGFVLSSAEFGRAYLSDGWATEFVRTILARYFVVFVGYTADDPPIQYLLEALNRGSDSEHHAYAFQAGSMSDAHSKWAHKGVTAIAYHDANKHQTLWDTLEAWASRARNPEGWYQKTIALARLGPEALPPHERGQVAHIVSTLEGARKFAEADTPPPADWLCAFDPHIRYSKPGRRHTFPEKGPYFNPFSAYGLDSDSIPPEIKPDDSYAKREVPGEVWSCFDATRLDRQSFRDDNFTALRGYWANHVPRLPARLNQIGTWICRVAHQPAAVWWAAQQVALHPDICSQIRHQLERTKVQSSPEVRKAWRYLIDAWDTHRAEVNRDYYELKASIDIDGWTNAFVRKLVLLYTPYIKTTRYWIGPSPPENRSDIRISDMVHLQLEYPSIDVKLHIPDDHLLLAVQEFRKNLEQAVSLEKEIGAHGLYNLPPIEPDEATEGQTYGRTRGISRIFLFFVGLQRRLIAKNPQAAKQEYLAWTCDDKTLFSRLRIWTAAHPEIVSAVEAGQLLCTLDDEIFWDSRHQRDLLLAFAKRWNEFPARTKKRIERRLLRGRPRWEGEKKPEHIERRAWLSLSRIHWLASHGCRFGFDLDGESSKLRNRAPEWQPQFAERAAASLESTSGWVRTETAYSALLEVPLSDVLAKSVELSGRAPERFVQDDPFAGLVTERPIRALAALTKAARQSQYPEWAWRRFLNSEARKSDKPKLAALVAERLSAIPADAFVEFVYPVSEWLLTSRKALRTTYPRQFGKVWDKLIAALASQSEAGKSSMVRGSSEPDWATEALNAPVGKLVQALMDDPQTEGLRARQDFPEIFIQRVDQLLALGGDMRQHALVMLSFNLRWWFHINPIWTEQNLISALQGDGPDADASWAGFLWGATTPTPEVYARLKPLFLRRARQESALERSGVEMLAGILLAGWGSSDQTPKERCVTNDEMRHVLIDAGESFRSQTLWQLERWSAGNEGDWSMQSLEFLSDVWPRHKKAKSAGISAQLCNIAFSNAASFPLFVDVILPLLTNVDQHSLMIPELRRSQDNIVDAHPEKVLALLTAILPESAAAWPYGIEGTIDRICVAAPSLLNDDRLIELKRRWGAR